MQGQWIGKYSGTNDGFMFIDIDDEGDHFAGHAFAFDENPELPATLARFRTADKSANQQIVANRLLFLNPAKAMIPSSEDLKAAFPGAAFPSEIKATLAAEGSILNMSFETNIGTSGSAALAGSEAGAPSQYQPLPEVNTWSDFREFVLALPPRKYMFRGQDCCNRLRTHFHRSRRKDLVKYVESDIDEAYYALASRIRHVFNRNDAAQNGAFLNLLQHHGYPTPLLDWSESPFVAAFFAFRHEIRQENQVGSNRIFIFDRKSWVDDFPQIQSITFCNMHFSIMKTLAIENLRALPQQSLSSVTNVDDIESYIRMAEAKMGKTYLRVVELPRNERTVVMEQLSLMGVTAGSLFPGLDGSCEELKGRYFHPWN